MTVRKIPVAAYYADTLAAPITEALGMPTETIHNADGTYTRVWHLAHKWPLPAPQPEAPADTQTGHVE